MEQRVCCKSLVRTLRLCLMSAMALPLLVASVHAQSAYPDAEPLPTGLRIDQLEQTLQSVVNENRRLAEEVRVLREQATFPAIEEPTPDDWCTPCASPQSEYDKLLQTEYAVGYDNGFVIRPWSLDESPFSLKFNNQCTFRGSGFSRDESTWIDSAGNVNPIENNSDFLIPRGRLIFSGNALAPDLSYLLNIDYNTVGRNAIGFRAYALSYRFSKALEVSVGQNKVPGTREWLLSSWVAQEGPDRSMATTFFRPSLSQGIWFRGEPADRLFYHAMLSNGFNTLNLTPDRYTHRLCFSESVWWEPWGDFGPGYADLEDHQQLVVRAGTSYTFALAQGNQADSGAAENSALRLSDGTLISQLGAFAPGVTLQEYNISLAAIDLAFKYRGFSLSMEGYRQDLTSLRGDGPLPLNSTQAYGGFLQGGYFVVPQRVELYSRTSGVTGAYGSGTELAGGFNWFPLEGKSSLRFTFDAAWLDSSPADQNRTGFEAGQTGLLIRAQVNTSF